MGKRNKNKFLSGLLACFCSVVIALSLLSAFVWVSGEDEESSSDISSNTGLGGSSVIQVEANTYSVVKANDFLIDMFGQDLSNWACSSNFSSDFGHEYHSPELGPYYDGCYCPVVICPSMARVYSISSLNAYFEMDVDLVSNIATPVKFYSETSDGDKTEVYSWSHSPESNMIVSPMCKVYFGDYYADFYLEYYCGRFYFAIILEYSSFGDIVFGQTEEDVEECNNYAEMVLIEILRDNLIFIDGRIVYKGLGVTYYDHLER